MRKLTFTIHCHTGDLGWSRGWGGSCGGVVDGGVIGILRLGHLKHLWGASRVGNSVTFTLTVRTTESLCTPPHHLLHSRGELGGGVLACGAQPVPTITMWSKMGD